MTTLLYSSDVYSLYQPIGALALRHNVSAANHRTALTSAESWSLPFSYHLVKGIFGLVSRYHDDIFSKTQQTLLARTFA